MNSDRYIKLLRKRGRCYFTLEEAIDDLGLSRNAVKAKIHRLKRKKEIVSPARGFYLIIPPEYEEQGCLPPDYFLPYLMKFLKLEYYIALLSAADYYGASHHKPQVFQVMTNKIHKAITCGNVKINFYKKANLSRTSIRKFNTPMSIVNVSTPEHTIVDILHYLKPSGGINHITTVFTELIETVDNNALIKLANESKEIAWVQRLGYILTKIECWDETKKMKLEKELKKIIENKKPNIIPLSPWSKLTGKTRDFTWRIAININLEGDT